MIGGPISAIEYQSMSPAQKGYVSYMQAAWNEEVPDKNPYPPGTPEHEQWNEGSFVAVLVVQDYDE